MSNLELSVNIPAGTLVSTSDAPPVTAETSEHRTLRSGSLSVAAPVRSQIAGTTGVALANTLTVIHRPILGIDTVSNPQALAFVGERESDDSLRSRAARALEGSGASTVGALVAALTTIEGIRQQDVQVSEDHVHHPGLIKITIAADLTPQQASRAAELIQATRPAGIKVLHSLPTTPAATPETPADMGGEPALEPPESGSRQGVWFPLGLRVKVVPLVSTLSTAEKTALSDAVQSALIAYVDALGIGQPVIYNALVAAGMAHEGVQDVLIEVFPQGGQRGRSNIVVPDSSRATINAEDVSVEVTGALVALDLKLVVELKGRLLLQDQEQALSIVRDDIATKLDTWLGQGQRQITEVLLTGQLPSNDDYAVQSLTYQAEYLDQGLILLKDNPELSLSDEQQPWLRTLQTTTTQADA